MKSPAKRITARGKKQIVPQPCGAIHSCYGANTDACTHNLYCDANHSGGSCGATDVYGCGGFLGKKEGVNIDLDALILKAMKSEARKRARG